MHRIIGSLTILMFGLVASCAAFADEETLQNDGFTDGAPVDFQGGFIVGEVAAARFVPQISCPCVVTKVTVLFGGASGAHNVGISVWEDGAGTATPGSLISIGDVTLVGANIALNEIDLSLTPIAVNGAFRVGLEFSHDGLPSVATDLDGTIDASANFILANVLGQLSWFQSTALGVSGDFVIRATIDNLLPTDTDGDGDPDVTDPDDDNDGIGDALDNEPLVASNFCIGGDAYIFSEMVVGPLTCAATTSITAVSPAEVQATGDLHLIAPIVNFESGFSVAGLLKVTSVDPCPGCTP